MGNVSRKYMLVAGSCRICKRLFLQLELPDLCRKIADSRLQNVGERNTNIMQSDFEVFYSARTTEHDTVRCFESRILLHWRLADL